MHPHYEFKKFSTCKCLIHATPLNTRVASELPPLPPAERRRCVGRRARSRPFQDCRYCRSPVFPWRVCQPRKSWTVTGSRHSVQREQGARPLQMHTRSLGLCYGPGPAIHTLQAAAFERIGSEKYTPHLLMHKKLLLREPAFENQQSKYVIYLFQYSLLQIHAGTFEWRVLNLYNVFHFMLLFFRRLVIEKNA